MRQGDLETAADCFLQVTTSEPRFAGGFLNLGLVRLQQGNWEKAIEAFHESVQLDANMRGAHLFLGIAEYRESRYADAEKELKREIALSPRNADAFMWLGVVQLVEGNNEGAVRSLDRAAEISPDNVDILYHRGRAHFLLSQNTYEHMYKVDPKSWRIHQVLAQAFVEQERYEDAARECKLAIQDRPRELGLHEQLGDIYWKGNNLAAAEQAFQEELDLDASNLSALYKLGTVSLETSKPEVTERIMRQLVVATPDSVEAHYQLARAEARLNQAGAAIEDFSFVTSNSARAEKEMLRESYYHLAQLYRHAQKPEESKKAMQVFMSMKQAEDDQQQMKLQDKLKRAKQDEESAKP